MVEVVEEVDDDVVVAGAVDVGARELTVDEDHLLGNSERRHRAVRHVPRKVQVRILRMRGHEPHH